MLFPLEVIHSKKTLLNVKNLGLISGLKRMAKPLLPMKLKNQLRKYL